MSKGAGEQTTTTSVDPQTAAMQKEVFDRARNAANAPYQPYTGQQVAGVDGNSRVAVDSVRNVQGQLANMGQQNLGMGNQWNAQAMYGQQPQGPQMTQQSTAGPRAPDLRAYENAGNVGARAMAGDQGAINQMWNPYQSKVLDEVSSRYGDLNAQAQMGINDAATRGGSFGGSRHGIAAGQASGDIAKGLGSQMAGMQYQGYNDMMGRAGQAAGMGMQAGNLNLGFGQLGLGHQQLGVQERQGIGQLGLGYDQLGVQNRLGMGQLGQNAMGMAQQGAGMQAGLAGQQFGMGDYFRNVNQQGLDSKRRDFDEQRGWQEHQLDLLNKGMAGNTAGKVESKPLTRNVASGVLGGAATGGAIGGPIGAGIGGVLGLFG